LMLARATSRVREVAVRMAMGASRGRVVQLLLTESVALAITGGLLGLGVAAGLLALLASAQAGSMPGLAVPDLDGSALAFASLASVGTGLLFGLAPAARLRRQDPMEALKESGARVGRHGLRTQGTLVVAQLAVSVTLLVSAGLLLRSVQRAGQVELGIEPEGLLTAQVRLPAAEYGSDRPPSVFWDAALERVRALPGVESATFAGGLPVVHGRGPWNYVWAEGREPATPADRQG
ncbi:MAG: FtsX-like permease family protein, partial [Gammaproteobacteria bacterium]|nr:FtsX-like permease family protein [Gemmatimonadota bacterium]NIU72313.1 FtsX-like permease family protein [Gammaproteobacteria bacterium]